MKKLGELKGTGFSAAVIEEVESLSTVRIRVLPPAWRADLPIAQSAVEDEHYLEATLDHAANDLVTEILKNPLIAERVDKMLADAHHEGMEAGWQEGRA